MSRKMMKKSTPDLKKKVQTKEDSNQRPSERPFGSEFRFRQVFRNDTDDKTGSSEEGNKKPDRHFGSEFRFRQIFRDDVVDKTASSEEGNQKVEPKVENPHDDQESAFGRNGNPKGSLIKVNETEKSKNIPLEESRKRINEGLTEDKVDNEAEAKATAGRAEIKHPEEDTVASKNSEPLARTGGLSAEKNVVQNVQESIDSMKGKLWITEEGKIHQGVVKILDILQTSESILESHTQVVDIILETQTVDKICELVVNIQEKLTTKEFKEKIQILHLILTAAIEVLINYSDVSTDLAERVAIVPGFLQSVHNILVDFSEKKLHQVESVTQEEHCLGNILNSALTIVYNVSMVESNIPHLRKLNFTEALQPYLKSKDKDNHLTALAGLAAIIDEEESEIINSNKKVVKHLMKVLRRALRQDDRRYDGWSCKELALVIKTLARNDANKKLLVQLGALQLLVKLSKGSREEQLEAVGAMWTLSFDDENRKIMMEDKKLDILMVLAELRDSDSEKIRSAADGALWNLRDDLRTPKTKKYQAREGPTRGKKQHRDEEGGHVMISYQWGNQKTLIDVRNELRKNGFKVWMDVDNMAGSTLQAMAEAVEDADVVLVCFSQKYKNSPNCRAEAEYTYQRQKYIIPLRMETDYKPDGWLGILVGTKLFYDFSGKYDFSDKSNQLLREISGLKKRTSMSEVPTKVTPIYHGAVVEEAPITQHAFNAIDRVSGWTPEDIKNWVTRHKLPEQECASMTVDEITLLLEMRKEAPEAFYKGLQKKFNYDLKMISQLVKALKAIDM